MLDLQAGLLEPHLDPPEASVARRVGARIANQVVRRRVGDDLRVDAAEVVGVEERLAARVARERDERVLARRLAVELPRHAAAGEHRRPAAAARLAGGAARHDRRQAARVDGIDRDVGLHGAVDRRAQLHLVVLAALGHAAAEIDDRLLLLDRRQRVGQLLDGGEAAIGVEDVELAVVGDEAVGVGLLAGQRRAFLEPDGIDAREPIERRRQRLAIGGEVLDNLQRRAHRGHGDEIGGRQPLGDVVVARCNRALELLGLHRARIEQQHDQPAVLEIDRLRLRGSRVAASSGASAARLRRRLGLENRLDRQPRARSWESPPTGPPRSRRR